ncbi:hypothetical protein BJ508DRAFT_32813 [Ascobolus immersus RN42]|uniref:Uncharacterized protein n=1 Tax=Ascobolus immersus RN42 TaxID=1160509 RepID=A0A3N4IG96_ASCIM|nr:hypothetical protein BJ508DRAFT_32813 [Ascobolus immersus RN42]
MLNQRDVLKLLGCTNDTDRRGEERTNGTTTAGREDTWAESLERLEDKMVRRRNGLQELRERITRENDSEKEENYKQLEKRHRELSVQIESVGKQFAEACDMLQELKKKREKQELWTKFLHSQLLARDGDLSGLGNITGVGGSSGN